MLIVEILLTFFAYRNGWKWLGLLPLGIAFGIGLILGASGMDPSDLGNLIWIDVLAIIALVVMLIKKGPNAKKTTDDTSESSKND
ncbi:MAG TPA: hypothetical protein VMX17_09250 [Candidatus Glassbacteria bacterium]|nr:hypothetical protein [Candidatus Glassbacteria bacterium]